MSQDLPTPLPDPSHGEFLLYQSEDGRVKLSVRIQDRTVWLTQRLIAELFQVSVKTANEHLVNLTRNAIWTPEQLSGNSG
jgi:hypothetical protein